MKKSNESAAETEAADLDFPDWSGMDGSSARLDPDAAFRLCEQYSVWFPEWAEKGRLQQPKKCFVEFEL